MQHARLTTRHPSLNYCAAADEMDDDATQLGISRPSFGWRLDTDHLLHAKKWLPNGRQVVASGRQVVATWSPSGRQVVVIWSPFGRHLVVMLRT